jgi:hypothetical protein
MNCLCRLRKNHPEIDLLLLVLVIVVAIVLGALMDAALTGTPTIWATRISAGPW